MTAAQYRDRRARGLCGFCGKVDSLKARCPTCLAKYNLTPSSKKGPYRAATRRHQRQVLVEMFVPSTLRDRRRTMAPQEDDPLRVYGSFVGALHWACVSRHLHGSRATSRYVFVPTVHPIVFMEMPSPMPIVSDGPFLLTCGEEVVNARSLAYAKALAPQMFQRMGTQAMFKTIEVTNPKGVKVGSYNRHGWTSTNPTLAAALDSIILNDCLGCDGYAPAGEVFCTPQCQLEASERGDVAHGPDGYSAREAA